MRDKEKREVDFPVVRDGRPWMLVECKSGTVDPSPALLRFAEILKPEFAIQLADRAGFDRIHAASKIRVMDTEAFLAGLV